MKHARRLLDEKERSQAIQAKDKEISSLASEVERLKTIIGNHEALAKANLATAATESARKLSELAATKNREIDRLQAELRTQSVRHEAEIEKERHSISDTLHNREQRITELTSQLKAQESAAKAHELELKEQNAALLRAKDEEIERYRDLKSRLSLPR